MKLINRIWLYTLITIALLIVDCSKEKEQGPTPPIVATTNITSITQISAEAGGNVTSDGGAEVINRGVCWDISENPTITNDTTIDGVGIGSFESNITGLIPNTAYYVRAYATNSTGTGYGNVIAFKTGIGITFNPSLTYVTLNDIEGNCYKTIQIGNQNWMAENLKTTKLKDGTNIPLVKDQAWASLATPAYCWYDNEGLNKYTYGAMYNWYAVNTGKLCPTGWHVPTDAEWTTLTTFLGGESVAGGKLKETGINHWQSPNTGATNESGFTALPGGKRFNQYAVSNNIKDYGYWWCSSEFSTYYAWCRNMLSIGTNVGRMYFDKPYGFSIRCIQD